jgi:uncharacterized protein YlxW (UPF0749 family)
LTGAGAFSLRGTYPPPRRDESEQLQQRLQHLQQRLQHLQQRLQRLQQRLQRLQQRRII